MFLRPQHFQQQERYLEFYANARSGAMGSHAWGFESLVLDADALKLGKVAIREARGLFPDGTPFSVPQQGEPPAPVDVPGDARGQRVLLALPIRRPGVEDVALGGEEGLTRVRVGEHEVNDANTLGSPAALMQVGDLRLRLLSEGELTDGWMSSASRGSPTGVPTTSCCSTTPTCRPHVALRACPPLEAFLRELEGLLHHRGEAVAARHVAAGPGRRRGDRRLPAARADEPLGAAHPAHAPAGPDPLRAPVHAAARARGRPVDVRARRPAPMEYPVYDHDDPQACFMPLMTDLRRSLSMVLEQNAIPIELHERAYGVRVAILPPVEVQRSAAFVLAVAADVPADVVRNRFPTQVKIGPVEKIRDLVNLHLPASRCARCRSRRGRSRTTPASTTSSSTRPTSSGASSRPRAASRCTSPASSGIKLEFWAIRGG
jgi:type VI secretion system protein ImpJ